MLSEEAHGLLEFPRGLGSHSVKVDAPESDREGEGLDWKDETGGGQGVSIAAAGGTVLQPSMAKTRGLRV